MNLEFLSIQLVGKQSTHQDSTKTAMEEVSSRTSVLKEVGLPASLFARLIHWSKLAIDMRMAKLPLRAVDPWPS